METKNNKIRELRTAFSSFMTGVTVVTTTKGNNQYLGFTANSFTSVSLEPPLLQVSLAKTSGNYQNFINAKYFAINILSEEQKEVSNIFASKNIDRFANIQFSLSDNNNPIINNTSAYFDCLMHQVIDAGDHTVLIGEVKDFSSSNLAGLGFYKGAYITPNKTSKEIINRQSVIISTIILNNDELLLIKKDENNWTLPSLEVNKNGIDETLIEIFNNLKIQAEANFVYSVYNNNETLKQFVSFLCKTNQNISNNLNSNFFNLSEINNLNLEDNAIKIMLLRLAKENQLKKYGVYYGNHNKGTVTSIN